MKKSLTVFKEKLETFAQKHKKEINKDPAFRAQFNQMCQKIGVDPLASNKGFWADILGVGDFYYELSVQIIEVCLQTRHINGGLIEMNELLHRVQTKRTAKSSPISLEDIKSAIAKVNVLGNGFGIITLGNRKIVKSVPVELNRDNIAILNLCEKNNGCTTTKEIKQQLTWPEYRIDEVLNLMVQEGMVWIDEQSPDGQLVYWIPSLWNNKI